MLKIILVLWSAAFAPAEDLKDVITCEPGYSVVVDCKLHSILFYDASMNLKGASDIECGKPGTLSNGTGKVGRSLGPNEIINFSSVGYGVDIDIYGLGMSGGKQVFHLKPPPGSGAMPTKQDISAGCIRLTQKALDSLGRCEGAKLSFCNVDQKPGCGEGTTPQPLSAPPNDPYYGRPEGSAR